MIYAMSDIHGCYDAFVERIEQLDNLETVKNGTDKLILLGDYIDRGPDSCKVLQKIFSLQKECGADNLIVLRGNHEEWFLDFIYKKTHDWLGEDIKLRTSRTFLNEAQLTELKEIAVKSSSYIVYDYVIQCIKENHKELLQWLKKLPYYYTTKHQIYVHAGVDEEAGDWWNTGTPEYCFVGKYPPTFGEFYKDIIAGHVSTGGIMGDKRFCGVYYDGASHYYIDGSVLRSGRIPVLAYDENTRKYYSLDYLKADEKNDVAEGRKVRGKLRPVKAAKGQNKDIYDM